MKYLTVDSLKALKHEKLGLKKEVLDGNTNLRLTIKLQGCLT